MSGRITFSKEVLQATGMAELLNLQFGKMPTSFTGARRKACLAVLAVSQQEKGKLLTCSVSVRASLFIFYQPYPPNGGSCWHPDVRNDERNSTELQEDYIQTRPTLLPSANPQLARY